MIVQLDHINIVVENLDRMIDFYTRVLGLKQTKRVTISGEWIGKVVGLENPHADVVYLDADAGPRIELIRYNRPAIARPENVGDSNAPGLRHFAFKVEDIDAFVARLRDAGVNFFSDIQRVPDSQVTYANGVSKRLVYFQDPEGNLLELCEYKSS
jgi:catechol 2,3-dioxygenase-like lactoylglutathione lyase family enzyme